MDVFTTSSCSSSVRIVFSVCVLLRALFRAQSHLPQRHAEHYVGGHDVTLATRRQYGDDFCSRGPLRPWFAQCRVLLGQLSRRRKGILSSCCTKSSSIDDEFSRSRLPWFRIGDLLKGIIAHIIIEIA